MTTAGEEKLYTQSDLNNAVTKAITDMSKVLEVKEMVLDKACRLLQDGYCVECYGSCEFSAECSVNKPDTPLVKYKPPCSKSVNEWKEFLTQKAREE